MDVAEGVSYDSNCDKRLKQSGNLTGLAESRLQRQLVNVQLFILVIWHSSLSH